MVKMTKCIVLLAFLCAPGCQKEAEDAPDTAQLSGTITLSGAWALYPMVIKWAQEFQALNPKVKIDVSAGGAGKGMADALAGAADIGMVSREIYPAEIEKGAYWFSVTKDAVVPTVSEDNPVLKELLTQGVRRETFIDIWITGKIKDWQQVVDSAGAHPISVYTRSDACGAAETWAKFLGRQQEDLLGVGVYGDPGLAEAVKKDNLGIGFNNINYVYDPDTKKPVAHLKVLPIDLNGNGQIDPDENFYDSRDAMVGAIDEAKYPSPPARLLHLVTRGAPQREVVRQFIRWILTEGQRYAAETGYIGLTEEKVQEELKKLMEP